MPRAINESDVEDAALGIFEELGYDTADGPAIAPPPEGVRPERESFSDVVLLGRLERAVNRINQNIPREAREDAIKKVLRVESPKLIVNNQRFHKMLVEGVEVEYKKKDGRIVGDKVLLFDFKDPENNDFLAVRQFTVVENNSNRRPDIVVFVNGLPLGVIELKNPSDQNATIWNAYTQFENYKREIPSLFNYNEILILTDGMEARAGTITSGKEWFLPWRTIDGTEIKSDIKSKSMEVLLKGIFQKDRFLDITRHFIAFEKEQSQTLKKLAGYHQYWAVNKALEATVKASNPKGDRRCGVVWHSQGSGKSLTMVFYTGKLVLRLDNPTIVVLTDRNDLDDQLFGTFGRCQDIFRQKPVQAETRAKLRELLKVASGGIVFTTIQKFLPEDKSDPYPLLSERRNIIVIADEAHRSQYDFIDGFARHMRDALPNASFVGFTATPIEKADKSTPAVFGNYIDVYDMEKAVRDGATVRIFYESRLAKLELKPEERPRIDPEFEEVTEGEEVQKKEKLKSKWARMEALVGSEKRIRNIARDVVSHFEERQKVLDGKAMIVCMSRRICVELHNEIIKLKPEWYHKDDDKGMPKVVMTGSATDPTGWQEHLRNKQRRREIGDRMKDPGDQLRIAIVRDMWLTGFDVKNLHTMYIDKPMRGHGLMQAIARVNRVFKDKDGGLIVDYIGIADELKKALAEYTEGDRKEVGIPQEEAVALMQENYEIACQLLHGYDYKKFFKAPTKDQMSIVAGAMEHILSQEDGRERFLNYTTKLLRAFALSVPHPEAIKIRDDVGFFQLLRSQFIKNAPPAGKTQEELDTAIRQIISKAITSDKVIDIFDTLGMKKPDISILSDEFLLEIKGMKHRNLAFELLKKLLNDEIRTRQRKNLIQSKSFAEMLEKSIKRYQNKTIETAKVIEELINLAKNIREANKRGEKLGLTEDELAFYDALEVNDSAVKVLGDATLRNIARELADTIRKNATIDWTLRESIQAKLRINVRRILKKYGYPPDKQKKATVTVLEQATIIAKDWAEAA